MNGTKKLNQEEERGKKKPGESRGDKIRMNIFSVLESTKQVKKSRKSEYERIRIGGENIRMHRAVKATGMSKQQLRNLKNLPSEERKEKEKRLLSKIKSIPSSTEIDHKDNNKNNNSKSNLNKMNKSSHTSKTNKTRA